MPDVRKPSTTVAHAGWSVASGPGSGVSPDGLLQDLLVESQIGHGLFEPAILFLQVLEALHVVGLHAAVLMAPAKVRLLGNAQLLTHVGHGGSTAQLDLGLTQLANNLFRRMTLPLHQESSCPSGRLDSHTTWTRKRGAGHEGPSVRASWPPTLEVPHTSVQEC